MAETKKILLVGRTGRGKSTLANVMVDIENNFKEGSGSISKTRNIQFEEFKDKENNINYLVIDTPGIGDTRLPAEKILDIIAEAVYLVRNGVSQVFFVTNGRFDQFEMITYNLLRETIFNKEITNYTTIVRTRFEEFRNKSKCEADINLMIKEAKEKKIELETKEKEIKDFSSDSEQYQKLFKEVEKLKNELKTTNLAEIVESCQKKIAYVNNPPIDVEDTNELELNKKSRTKSRTIILEHLKKNYLETLYKPPKLTNLTKEIISFMEEKIELQKQLEELKKTKEIKLINSQASKVEGSKNNSQNTSTKDNKIKIRGRKKKQAEQTEINAKNLFKFGVGVIFSGGAKRKPENDEEIKKLEEEKRRLKKEIVEKEKIIRQKVRKHILNNYNDIAEVEGGDIFIDTVIDISSWRKIHEKFTNELVKQWLSNKFDDEKTQAWAKALGSKFSPTDASFCAWLRDNKQLTVEKVLKEDVKLLRQEYQQQLKKEVAILNQHKQKLDKGEEVAILNQHKQKLDKGKRKKSKLSKQNFQQLIRLTFGVEVAQAFQAQANQASAQAWAQAAQNQDATTWAQAFQAHATFFQVEAQEQTLQTDQATAQAFQASAQAWAQAAQNQDATTWAQAFQATAQAFQASAQAHATFFQYQSYQVQAFQTLAQEYQAEAQANQASAQAWAQAAQNQDATTWAQAFQATAQAWARAQAHNTVFQYQNYQVQAFQTLAQHLKINLTLEKIAPFFTSETEEEDTKEKIEANITIELKTKPSKK